MKYKECIDCVYNKDNYHLYPCYCCHDGGAYSCRLDLPSYTLTQLMHLPTKDIRFFINHLEKLEEHEIETWWNMKFYKIKELILATESDELYNYPKCKKIFTLTKF